MKKQVLQFTLFLLLLLLSVSCSPTKSMPKPISDDDIFKEFTGEYPLADGLGLITTDLSIKSDKTFHFEVFTDSGGHGEQNGSTEMNNGKIQLLVSSERLPLVPSVLIPVKWGEREYLIDGEKIEDFCLSVKNGNEPRTKVYGNFHLKDGDWEVSVTGQPTSPDGQAICP
ncbi:MAG: hypothetical protein U0X74_00525 [Anaerolineales bacterium]